MENPTNTKAVNGTPPFTRRQKLETPTDAGEANGKTHEGTRSLNPIKVPVFGQIENGAIWTNHTFGIVPQWYGLVAFL